ncbi:uncharacterized protein LOC131239499 [Magnolia sinica]|uniref:uncharacterized protein LOC131239499 n=1 Tax=Magnolia sinica TaxID=86752 RepID=UPI0026580A57|nr:uncharacterized protein LOC131239499 [Magnolia sinica]XP_058093211.1 uncharacterized protein LOC131239499 [Magnolia sinica]XP_058093212.1 uncharacterized protein LOC131239499 [Magnolia sinica]
MQTKKKLPARNAARQHARPRHCRQQKEESENAQIAEKKVADLITSSARKQRFVKLPSGILSKKSRDTEAARSLNASYILPVNESQDICLAYETIDGESIDPKGCKDRTAECALGTIFSPAYHVSKAVGGDIHNTVDVVEIFPSEGHRDYQDSGYEESKVDTLRSFEASNPSEEQNPSKNTRTVSTTCHDDMNIDSIAVCSDKYDFPDTLSLTPFTEGNNAFSRPDEEDTVGGNLSSEVSAIYLAMQQSKLECVDEPCQDSISAGAYVEADEDDEIDDFDPYLFIGNLPELSAVVPTFRPMLLPKQTRSCPPTTLVLDLDETLVHSTLEHCEDADFTFPVNFNFKEHTVYVRCRPHLKDFMERAASLFEIIIFTASQSIYAEQLLNVLDPKRRIFRHRVYRESCVFVEGNYLKDLSVLGRDLARVIIIDNSPQAFGFQVDNGIPIESWFDDRSDQALLSLLPFLETLVGVEDVRPLIAKKFNLRERVAAAANPPLSSNKGDPFERKA